MTKKLEINIGQKIYTQTHWCSSGIVEKQDPNHNCYWWVRSVDGNLYCKHENELSHNPYSGVQ